MSSAELVVCFGPYQQRVAARLLDRKIATAGLAGTVSGPSPYVVSGWFFLRRGLQDTRGSTDVFVDFGSGKGKARLGANIERNRSRASCQNV